MSILGLWLAWCKVPHIILGGLPPMVLHSIESPRALKLVGIKVVLVIPKGITSNIQEVKVSPASHYIECKEGDRYGCK